MKKLILLPSLILASFQVNAQSINAGTHLSMYSDIVPDSLMNYTVAPYTNEVYGLNLFGSAANDIEFTAHGAVSSSGSSAYISITSLDPNVFISEGRLDSVFTISSSTWNVTKIAKPLTMGQQINTSGAVWDNTTLYLTDHSGSGGGNKDVNDFIGGDKYIVLKYQSGSTTTYGWIRVGCVSEDSCYIKEYSSGSSSVGISENVKTSFSVYPNPSNGVFTLKGSNLNAVDQQSITLKNICGEAVKFSMEEGSSSLIFTMDPALPNGYYFLQYSENGVLHSVRIIRVNK